MIKTFRTKLLFTYFLFLFFSLSIILASAYYIYKKKKIENFIISLNEIKLSIYQDTKAIDDFLSFEIIDTGFFETHKSQYLDLHNNFKTKINKEIDILRNNNYSNQFAISNSLDSVWATFNIYDSYVLEITDNLEFRGYIDYGLEGKMRKYAHKLEKVKEIDFVDLLLLRRHEKDYILRHEEKYIRDFNERILLINNQVIKNQTINNAVRDSLLGLIQNYSCYFLQLTTYDKTIGIYDNTGLRANIGEYQKMIINQISEIICQSAESEKRELKKLHYTFILILLLILALSIVFGFIISNVITKPIIALSENVENFIKNNFKDEIQDIDSMREDEIGQLTNNYQILKKEIIAHILYLNEKVRERTTEVEAQKEELKALNEELYTQTEALSYRNIALLDQQAKIEQQNRNILDSIQYASRIQRALLPKTETINKIIPHNFILYLPRDIVSGDFYFVKQIEDSKIFIVADCTGHGVPGAFMSLLGMSFIDEIIRTSREILPNRILDDLRNEIKIALKQADHDSESEDGMEIGFCLYNTKTSTLQYSGAGISLWIARNDEIIEITADPIPVGIYPEETPYTIHNIKIQPNDVLYMFSDGFADQFGGDHNKKFSIKNLKSMLISISKMPMRIQKDKLEHTFKQWKGEKLRQVDDILVMGVILEIDEFPNKS